MRTIPFTILVIIIFVPICYGQNYNVGETTLSLTDSSRHRPIITEIWYPTSEQDTLFIKKTELPFILEPTIRNAGFIDRKQPLILLSHGTGGNRFSLAWLAIALARHGYIVASPDHWGNTYDNKIPAYFIRYWERPLDISYIITFLTNDNKFSGYIDNKKIGAAGFSFGGYTSLALAGAVLNCELLKSKINTPEGKKEFTLNEIGYIGKLFNSISCDSIRDIDLKDNRISAFAAMSPAAGLGFDSDHQTDRITKPVLIIGTENDQVAPVATNARIYHELIHSSQYVEIPGRAGHYVFLDVGNENLQKKAKIYYKDDSSVNRELIHNQTINLIMDFFDRNINN